VFLQENMDKRDGVTTSSKEQMRTSVRVRVQDKITSKGGKDQGATTNHPRGLRRKVRKVRTSYEKTPYLHHEDDDLKITQMKGPSAKCEDESRGERWARTNQERAWAGRPGRIGPGGFCGGSSCPLT
jgi:hypothetical protein